jgi:hypothetical protein
MFVFILDTNKQPLNPTHPARARKLLRSGRASVFRKYPFTIILHDREEKNSTQEFLTGKQDLLNAVLGQLKRPLADAAAVNTTRWVLFRQLKELHLPVETGTGGQTKYNRTRQGLDKTHWLDAANVGSSTPERLKILVHKPLLIKAEGWGSRQMVNKNKYGFPLTNKEGKQAAKTRSPIQFGFRTGDIVRAIVPIGKHKGVHIGKVTVRKSGAFDVISNAIKRQSIRWKHCKPLHRKDGYSYA